MVLDIRPAVTPADFRAVHALVAQMAAWDEAATRAEGYPSDAVIGAYYRGNPDDLRVEFTTNGAGLLLACEGGSAFGCLGFSPMSDTTAELEKYFVLDAARGRGIGQQLLDAVLGRLRAEGYWQACLETAFFMTGALTMYARAGFRTCPPFRAPPPGLAGLSVFLDRTL